MERRAVIVSGGSKGLGLGIVRACLKEGYNVCTFSRSQTKEITALLKEYPDNLHYLVADQKDPGSAAAVVKAARQRFHHIHALVNNAAVGYDGLLAIMPPHRIEELIQINVTSSLLLTRECVREFLRLPRTEPKTIVSISSIVSLTGYRGLSAYAATKSAMIGMTKSLAREIAPANVTVNAVLPGFLETEMTGSLGEAQRASVLRRVPLGRMGTTEDVLPMVLFLMGEGARFITGQTFVVDGGSSC
ncbi:short-chain dehydrogenase/reductase SDR [Candidatus Koribacter versatilis Ellin345]|uniref:Short-chain dehydrogenase/reductase SDR n=1 Tax=Koribacter versatilis (strain Ellin345) TaxID=204669 RepID=Q1IRX4_KORVE|nr:SDR family oxidoreductase [Candidatus Koribacter versatilis]ABF40376.1 short-chain dehydrogenase/reductase SDR [Candidatus Koribacter versatilis Ellin345]